MAWYACPRCKRSMEWRGRNTKTMRDHCDDKPVLLKRIRKPRKPCPTSF